jgi:hypothetical protein
MYLLPFATFIRHRIVSRFRIFIFTVISLWLCGDLYAQGVRGRVIDQDGNPLPFSTIYINETGSGSISNDAGTYELRLAKGNYTITFQHLGFASQLIKVQVGDEFVVRDIVLTKQAYLLGEAEVKAGDEDPAYKIMRKAIAKSGYHRQQVDSYSCQVYLKGGGRLSKVPWFARKMIEEEGIDTSATFVTESVSEISYERPGKYTERVISVRTTGDDQDMNPMAYINSSLYEPEIAEMISPLSGKAFAYYKFRYIRTFDERGYQVNEIEVIPRSKGQDVLRGRLFIVEGLWCIHSASFISEIQGIEIKMRQVYAPVMENVWLPVSHRYDGSGKLFGFGFEFQYLAAVTDYKVAVNDDLDADFVVKDSKTESVDEPKSNKRLDELKEQEQKLRDGEELSAKELRKMMKAYETEERKKSDEPLILENRNFKIDSLASKADSAYWAEIRPVPLNEREIKGYKVQDSLAVAEKKKAEGDTLDTGKGKFQPFDLLLGNTYNLKKGHYLTIESPLSKIAFNSVDGWNFEYRLKYLKRIDKNQRLEISPMFRYGFTRNVAQGTLRSEYRYGQALKKGRIKLEGGFYYSQFNSANPITTFTNSISTLFAKNNFMKIYDRDFINLQWDFKPRHNIKINTELDYSIRRETFNNTDYSFTEWGNSSFTPNAPTNDFVENTSFGKTEAAKIRISAEYRPGVRYFKRNENYYRRNNPPTLTLKYEKGLPDVFASDVNYDLLALEVKHLFDLRLLGKLAVRAEAGSFVNNSEMDFMDFAHFMGNQTIFTRFEQMRGYSIAPYYRYSTNDSYLSTYINYEFRQFLFTNINALRLTGVKENINFNMLMTPDLGNYSELGYSVDNIFSFFRFDITASFIDGSYNNFRVQLGITSDLFRVE